MTEALRSFFIIPPRDGLLPVHLLLAKFEIIRACNLRTSKPDRFEVAPPGSGEGAPQHGGDHAATRRDLRCWHAGANLRAPYVAEEGSAMLTLPDAALGGLPIRRCSPA